MWNKSLCPWLKWKINQITFQYNENLSVRLKIISFPTHDWREVTVLKPLSFFWYLIALVSFWLKDRRTTDMNQPMRVSSSESCTVHTKNGRPCHLMSANTYSLPGGTEVYTSPFSLLLFFSNIRMPSSFSVLQKRANINPCSLIVSSKCVLIILLCSLHTSTHIHAKVFLISSVQVLT